MILTVPCESNGFLRTGNVALTTLNGNAKMPAGCAGEMPMPALPRPRESRICVNNPPKLWPMMMGGEGRAEMMDAYLSTIVSMPALAIGSGLARISSGVRSSTPGQPGAMTLYPLASKYGIHSSQLSGVIQRPWMNTMVPLEAGVGSVILYGKSAICD